MPRSVALWQPTLKTSVRLRGTVAFKKIGNEIDTRDYDCADLEHEVANRLEPELGAKGTKRSEARIPVAATARHRLEAADW